MNEGRDLSGFLELISSTLSNMGQNIKSVSEDVKKLESKLDNYNGLREKVFRNVQDISNMNDNCRNTIILQNGKAKSDLKSIKDDIKMFVGFGFAIVTILFVGLTYLLKLIPSW